MTGTVADTLVEALLEHGFDTVIGIGGTHTMRLLGALERRGGLRFVPARTEIGAAHTALGYAKASGRPAVLLTSTGPGCLNVTAALQDAQWSSLPLLHITTSVVSSSGFAGQVHETPAQRLITEAAGKGTVVVQDDDVVGALRHAVQLLQERPRGAVTLDVPAGTWDNPVPESAPPVEPAAPAAPSLEPLVASLGASSRPLLFVGGGAMSAPTAPEDVMALAERLQAPVLTSHQGKAVATWEHPLYLGPWASEPAVRELCGQADAVLVLGSKLSALGTGYHRLELPATAWTVGPGAPHPRYPQLERVPMDALEAARALAPAIEPKQPWATDQVAALQHDVRRRAAEGSAVEVGFLEALSQSPCAPRLVSADMCKAGFWVMKHLPAGAGAVHAFSSYLTMGTALPMAMGLALARQEPSLAVIGDGGLQMCLSELATLAELALPVVIMVGVDGAYGMLRDNSAAVGGSTDLGLSLWNPDLHRLAQAFGIDAEDVVTPGDLRQALSRPTTGPRMLLQHTAFSRGW